MAAHWTPDPWRHSHQQVNFRAKTPQDLTPPIVEFCKRIAPKQTPTFLPVTPATDAELLACFPTVEKQVAEHGGELQLGWQIWEWPDVMMEAEFHAVWRDPSGNLHDLTPKPFGTRKILFLPDPSATYDGRQVNSIREPVNNSPGGRLMIEARDAEFELMNRGERAHQHGEIRLKGSEVDELEEIQRKMARATQMILGVSAPLGLGNNPSVPRVGRNDPCPCGSGKKFKKCHLGKA